MPGHNPSPNLTREQALWDGGVPAVAGVDEAGRGALAGPVVAAAVVLRAHSSLTGVWKEVRDSKLLTATEREGMEVGIQARAAAWATGAACAAEVDCLGIAPATRLAMARAIGALCVQPLRLLIDWVRLPEVNIAQTSWAKADRDSVSVAAASILAKVARDRLLVELDGAYPAYGFGRHKGYGTEAHRRALAAHGPCPEHRLSFAPVAQYRSLFDVELDATAAPAEPARGGG